MNNEEVSQNELFEIQKKIMLELKESGIDPYGEKFERNGLVMNFKNNYEEGKELIVAGRITATRNMGKTRFWDLTDQSGRIQLFINPKVMNEGDFKNVPKLGLGDIIGVKGTLFKTKTGEISIRTTQMKILSKSLRPMPEKYHGLKDVESRYRQRYLDLMVNQETKDVFLSRSKIIRSIRTFLDGHDYLEVETPMLQSLYGGAQARPFITHHNALSQDMYLRIAPELYLKRLLVGGLEKVYEMNRNFRNEGLSRRHNPEFTMLEIYSAYDDYKDMMDLCEQIVRRTIEDLSINEWVLPSQQKVELSKPFKRISLFDAVKEYGDVGLKDWEDLRGIGQNLKINGYEDMDEAEILYAVFEEKVESKLIQPTFIVDFPSKVSPLSKKSKKDDRIAERFEFFIDGQEIANAYSEQNDPIEQKKRFIEQLDQKDDELTGIQKKVDDDYVNALEHGMPPAGGLGIGIDRLVIMLTGANSIREVILFPMLKNQGE